MSHVVADMFLQAAGLTRNDPRRKGNTLVIPEGKQMIVSGDIHGNRTGLQSIIKYANLSADPNRCLVLQEIIHGLLDPKTQQDRSIELLMRAARLKISHPQQVFFVIANHDVAQVAGSEITKAGRGVCKSFVEGLHFAFKDNAEKVQDAVYEFLRSLPLAVRCANGVLISHSLPSPHRMELAGTEILSRVSVPEDFNRPGAVYEWTWGRNHTPEQLESLAQQLGVEFFLLAHQHNDDGFCKIHRRAAAVLSDNQYGYITEFADTDLLNGDNITDYLKPLAALGH